MNFPYLLEAQARHVAWVIAWALERAAVEVEASAEAEQAWVDQIVARGARTADSVKYCTPGYYNAEGQADARTRQGGFYFGGPTEYAEILESWRSDGTAAGLDVRTKEPTQ
ncbi:MAG: hypothetical protein R6X23_04420 [Acidimicrobiia bacterium]